MGRKESKRRWRLKNREHYLEMRRKAYHRLMKNPEWLKKRRKHMREYTRLRRKTDLAFRLGQTSGDFPAVPIDIRRKLVARAEGKCEQKGLHKGKLGIHHIDEDRYNNEMSNLLLVCQSHHNSLKPMDHDKKGRFKSRDTVVRLLNQRAVARTRPSV